MNVLVGAVVVDVGVVAPGVVDVGWVVVGWVVVGFVVVGRVVVGVACEQPARIKPITSKINKGNKNIFFTSLSPIISFLSHQVGQPPCLCLESHYYLHFGTST